MQPEVPCEVSRTQNGNLGMQGLCSLLFKARQLRQLSEDCDRMQACMESGEIQPCFLCATHGANPHAKRITKTRHISDLSSLQDPKSNPQLCRPLPRKAPPLRRSLWSPWKQSRAQSADETVERHSILYMPQQTDTSKSVPSRPIHIWSYTASHLRSLGMPAR